MDHARHMSSPSPTSFLFQHSERSYKSNLLNPSLLTSTNDLSNVDDYFSASSTAPNSHLSNLNGHIQNSFGDNHEDDHEHIILVGDENHHDHVNHNNNHHAGDHQHLNNDQIDHCVINQRSLKGVGGDNDDDVDSMHNMLSGSSTSSATTMPLLTESHSHHPFSRISLEEYSPLSLVDDCDNALTISPTSLACGSHHPFKTSLNNLKIGNLDGVDVGVHDHVDDDVHDARSMSPSLLSASTDAVPNHLWSNSSTAITQNPALLTSSSTSFLLSHHHHNQLNSLMQQLEPQSLDEPPPLISNNSSLEVDQNLCHRPSSEPPPGSGLETASNGAVSIETKSVCSQPNTFSMMLETHVKPKATLAKVVNNKSKLVTDSVAPIPPASSSTSSSSSRSSRGDRNKAASSSASKQQQVVTNVKGTNQPGICKLITPAVPEFSENAHCSKVHLQLNHHQKLKELQQRLFGTVPPVPIKTEAAMQTNSALSEPTETKPVIKTSDSGNSSSGGTISAPAHTSEVKITLNAKDAPDSAQAPQAEQVAATQTTPPASANYNKTRSRSNSRRRSKQSKIEKDGDSLTAPPSTTNRNSKSTGLQKLVVTEKAEPDTTTKTSDCIKLADLLSTANSTDIKNTNFNIVLNGAVTSDANNISNQTSGSDNSNTNVSNTNEKRIQHFQLQVSPSLTVVSNGGMMQPIGMQHQAQITTDGTIVCSGVSTQDSQVICRPVTVMTSMGGNCATNGAQVNHNSVANNNELYKGADTALISNWSNATQQNNSCGNNVNGPVATISNNSNAGGHQIAIQVICQDGTSLVLPVSSNLNAVSLTPQQLQAISGGTGNLNGQRNSSHMLPLVSVANIIAQQQTTGGDNGTSNNSTSSLNQVGLSNNTTQSSGLAASSPTLAALLDAGTGRNNNNSYISSEPNSSGPQKIVSSNLARNNLLRKLIGGTTDTFEYKPGDSSVNEPTALRQKLNSKPCKSTTSTETVSNKQCKMTSSTGNRQVDPAQPFRCEHCNSTFTRLGNFTRHKKIHTVPIKDGQRFKCDVCSKSFLQRCDLARHLHIHRGTEPHRCNICGKGYIRHSDLVTHQRFHNKEKPFGCPHCSKGFCQRGDLNRHLRSIHLQMKPILCPCCNRKFAKQETLLRHLNTAHRGRQGGPL